MGHLIAPYKTEEWQEATAYDVRYDDDGRPVDGRWSPAGYHNVTRKYHYVYCDNCGNWTIKLRREQRGVADTRGVIYGLSVLMIFLSFLFLPLLVITVPLGFALINLEKRIQFHDYNWFMCQKCGLSFSEKLDKQSNPRHYTPQDAIVNNAQDWWDDAFSEY